MYTMSVVEGRGRRKGAVLNRTCENQFSSAYYQIVAHFYKIVNYILGRCSVICAAFFKVYIPTMEKEHKLFLQDV
jgi:hypothetical protein